IHSQSLFYSMNLKSSLDNLNQAATTMEAPEISYSNENNKRDNSRLTKSKKVKWSSDSELLLLAFLDLRIED
ncbi:7345_t:CDS:2, partial [Funneliformis caledonium]